MTCRNFQTRQRAFNILTLYKSKLMKTLCKIFAYHLAQSLSCNVAAWRGPVSPPCFCSCAGAVATTVVCCSAALSPRWSAAIPFPLQGCTCEPAVVVRSLSDSCHSSTDPRPTLNDIDGALNTKLDKLIFFRSQKCLKI